jgi:hypothetical protein
MPAQARDQLGGRDFHLSPACAPIVPSARLSRIFRPNRIFRCQPPLFTSSLRSIIPECLVMDSSNATRSPTNNSPVSAKITKRLTHDFWTNAMTILKKTIPADHQTIREGLVAQITQAVMAGDAFRFVRLGVKSTFPNETVLSDATVRKGRPALPTSRIANRTNSLAASTSNTESNMDKNGRIRQSGRGRKVSVSVCNS